MAITLTAMWRHITVVIMHTLTRISLASTIKELPFSVRLFSFCNHISVRFVRVVGTFGGTLAKREYFAASMCTALHCIQKKKNKKKTNSAQKENSKARICFFVSNYDDEILKPH